MKKYILILFLLLNIFISKNVFASFSTELTGTITDNVFQFDSTSCAILEANSHWSSTPTYLTYGVIFEPQDITITPPSDWSSLWGTGIGMSLSSTDCASWSMDLTDGLLWVSPSDGLTYLYIFGLADTGPYDPEEYIGYVKINVSSGIPSIPPSVIINNPTNTETLENFNQFNISWNNLGTDLKQLGIHYSENLDTLNTCTEFPTTIGYEDCINSNPRIYSDYGIATTLNSGTINITKNTPLISGKTYYAQAVIQENNQYGNLIVASTPINFTIGIPTGEIIGEVSCETFDITCYIKNAFAWLFKINDSSLNQFSNLTLENSYPFSYIYDMGNVYDELFNNSSDMSIDISIDTQIGEIDLLTADMIEAVPFADTIKTILSYMIYLFTTMTLYRILLKVHDNNTHA